MVFRIIFYIVICLVLSTIATEKIITLNAQNTIKIDRLITEDLVSKVIYQLSLSNHNPIYLYINTPGGDVKWGNLLIDNIEYYSKNKTIICIANYAASMGFAILQACPIRYGTKHSTFMQHKIKTTIDGDKQKIDNYIKYLQYLENEFIDFQVKRIGINRQQFIENTKTDWYLTGIYALKENIIDELVLVGCDLDYTNSTYIEIEYKDNIKIHNVYSNCPMVTKPI